MNSRPLSTLPRRTSRWLFSSLAFAMLMLSGAVFGQSASTYSFVASSGTYTELATGTDLPLVRVDSYISPAQAIGFNFVYEGITYTQFKMSSNGVMSLNPVGTSNLTTNDLSAANATSRPIIAPLWDDNDGNVATPFASVARYAVSGSSPNQVLTVEWRYWQWNYGATGNTISHQVKLYEGTGVIEFIYRAEAGAVNSGSASIGIGSATGSGPGSYLNVTNIASPAVSSTVSTTNLSTKPATGTIYTFSPPGPCAGIPAPGNTTGPAMIGSGETVNLGLQNTTNGTGVTYQWYASTTSAVAGFSPVGTSSSTYSAVQNVKSWYYADVSCAGNTTSSNVLEVGITYCTPTTSNTGDHISNFSTTGGVTNITNPSGSPASPGNYGNFTAMAVSAADGTSFNFSTTYVGGANGVRIWVDWNNNMAFEPGESVFYLANTNAVKTGTITVPASTAPGNYRMRVRAQYGSTVDPPPCGSVAYGETEDYTVTVFANSVCSGTPAPGNTTGPAAVFSGSTVSLGLQNPTLGSGVSYQWYVSTTSAVAGFTAVGPNAPNYAPVQTAKSWYYADVTCAGNTTSSNVLLVDLTYCTPAPTSVDGSGITRVQFSTVNNPSGSEPGNYGDYSALIGNVTQGTTVPVAITYSAGATYDTKIWIDWNDDMDFDDAGEDVYTGVSLAANPTTLNASFVVGMNPLGNHRMRIGGRDLGAPTPCYVGTWGTYEDYTVNVVADAPCAGIPTPGNTTGPSSAEGGVPFTLGLQTPPAGSGVTYQWYVSTTSAVAGFTATGTNSATLTTTQSAVSWYYADVTCDGNTASSTVKQVTVAYCAATNTSSTNYYISDFVTTGGFTNITNNATGFSPSGYGDFSAQSVSQSAGSAVNFTATFVGGTMGVAIWVDWNNDLDFADAGEAVFSSGAYVNSPYSNTITVPPGTPVGSYRMRLRTDWISQTPTACGSSNYAETEDYTFVVAPPPTCLAPSVFALANASFTALDVSWTPLGNAVNYFWEIRVSGQPGSGATGLIASGSGAAALANITGLTANTNYSFYARTDCDEPALSAWSAPFLVRTGLCLAGAGPDNGNDMNISNVTFSNINNSSSSTLGYQDFTAVVGNVVPGETYQLSISRSTGYLEDQIFAWINWNGDLDFDDAGEQVLVSIVTPANPTMINVTVPLGTPAGNVTMRIRRHNITTGVFEGNSTPCGDSDIGQVEDYTISICGSPTASASITAEDCVAQTFEVTYTVTDIGTGATAELQYSFNGVAQTPIPYAGSSIAISNIPVGTTVTSRFVNNLGCYAEFAALYSSCDIDLDCGAPAILQSHCYETADNRTWTYINSDPTGTVALKFLSGEMELADQFLFWEGAVGVVPAFPASLNGELTDQGLTSTGNVLSMSISTDGTGSCADGAFGGITWNVRCGGCTEPSGFVTTDQNDLGFPLINCTGQGTGTFNPWVAIFDTGIDGTSGNPPATVGYRLSVNGVAQPDVTGLPGGDFYDLGTFALGTQLNVTLLHEDQVGQSSCNNTLVTNFTVPTSYCGPVNDNCANALPITVGAPGSCPGSGVTANTFAATMSTPGPVCASNVLDVWYSVNTTDFTNVQFLVSAGTASAVGVEVFTACGTPYGVCLPSVVGTTYNYNLPPASYQLRLFTTEAGAGTFNVCFTGTVPPPGNSCATAIDLGTQTSPLSGSTAVLGTSSEFGDHCTATWASTAPDLVYFLDVLDGYTLNLTNTAAYDAVIRVAYGPSCPGNTVLFCWDSPNGQTNTWVNTTGSTQRVYWIQDGYFVGSTGAFTLAWSLVAPPVPCTGTPAPGNTTGPSVVASGATVNLGLQNTTTDLGLTYQWFVSTTSSTGPWTPVGTNAPTYSAVQTVQSWYYSEVTCAGNTGSSTVRQVDVVPVFLVPLTGNNTLACGSNVVLQDHAGSGDYSSSANGYTVLQAGDAATITISGSYVTEASYDYIRIYSGVGTGGTQVIPQASGTGTINFTGAPGQTLTVQFQTDGSGTRAGFDLSVSYTGACILACTTPAPGATTGPAVICSGTNFTLGIQNLTLGSGVSYQWQRDTGAGMVNFGTNAATQVVSQTVATSYQVIVTCTAGTVVTGTSTPIAVGMNPSSCECGSYAAIYSSSTVDEQLTTVTVGSMTNNSTCGAVAPGAGSIAARYSNYTGSVAGPTAQQGTAVTFSVGQGTLCGGSYGNGVQIYVDWNQDGVFNATDERVFNQPAPATGVNVQTGSFTVPYGATLGTTRMRIVLVEGTFPNATNYAQTAYTWGETEDYCFTVTLGDLCSGTPAPGATTGPSVICSSRSFTLGVQNNTPGSGVSYQWQRDTGSGMVNFGTNASTQVVSQTVATTYQVIVTCTAGTTVSGTSTPITVALNPNACECPYSAIYSSSTADEQLTTVTVGSMTNNTACGAVAPGAGSIAARYGNYTGSVAGPTAQQGTSVSFSVGQGTLCGGSYGNGVQIYVDWNQDGVFNATDERVFNQPTSANGVNVQTGSFNVPFGSLLGTTRMRIVVVETTFPTVTNYAETAYSWGETEDYCFTVTAGDVCTTPAPGATTGPTTVCSGTSFNLGLTNGTTGSGVSYQWYVSTTSSTGPWTPVGTSASTLTTSQNATSWYYAAVTCSTGPSTVTSDVLQVGMKTLMECLCTPTVGSNAVEPICSVSFGSMSNSSCEEVDCDAGYVSYTTTVTPPTVVQGQSYDLSVTGNTDGFTCYYTAFFDWNQDGVFEDVQPIGSANDSECSTVLTVNVTIPATATGLTLMRIIKNFNSSPTNPCGSYSYGQAEDYYIDVAAPVLPCTNYTLEFQSGATNPNDVTYEVLNAAGTTTVLSGNNSVPAGGVGTLTLCLPDGCYQLRVTDLAGDGITGYVLRRVGAVTTDNRIIDNYSNFTTAGVSAISGGPSAFCLPIGEQKPIFVARDKMDWVNGEYLVCEADQAVSDVWLNTTVGSAQRANSGYQFWFFDPNGNYSYRRNRDHATSDNFGPADQYRACHMKINNWAAANQIPANRLMNVRVRTRVNGVYGEFGPAYRFKIDPVSAACPLTKLNDIPNQQYMSCNSTRNWGPNNFVHARQKSGANKYQFRFRIAAENFVVAITSNTYFLQLNWTNNPLQAGKTYDVDVRVSKDGGATWCTSGPSWGESCTLTITNGADDNGQNMSLVNSSEGLSMWPNPNAGDQLYLDLQGIEAGVEAVAVDIYDMTGKLIVARMIPAQGERLNTVLNLDGDLATGLYLVNITAGNKRYTERLVIAN